MATVAPAPTAADHTTDLLQKLSLESKKDGAVTDGAKKSSGMPYGSANASDAASQVDRSITPLLQEAMDPNFFYQPNGYTPPAYYYPSGYDGSAGEWDSRYTGHEGMEMPPTVYGDMYHGYGYAPYGPYPSGSPVPTVGHDGQSYATQQYQYPPQYYQPPTPTNPTHGINGSNSQSELPSVASHQARIVVDTTKIGANGSASGMPNANSSSIPRKQNHLNVSVASNGPYGRGPVQGGGPSASSYGHSGIRSPVQWYDGPIYSNGHQRQTTSSTSYRSNSSSVKSQSQRPTTNLMGMHGLPSSGMGLASSYPTRMYPDSRVYGQYGQYGNTQKGWLSFGSNVYNARNNARWGVVETKYKPRGRAAFGFGSENQDGFTELNRGPRSGGFKHQKQFGSAVTIAVKGQAIPSVGKQENVALPDKTQFNQEGFPVTYKDAKFFVIKSYSEDDVHKSIKYNVWASTPNGNKKLDAGYREAQEKDNDCPVFLFFSVNTSGQFVGVAEMVGPVNFEKTVEYWQQDKWNGCFPLKWHIVKDVPNNILKHITLDNNDNKPVTNSRDTQEVKLEQGLEMLKIFKEHASKTSILDDFGFYENRQKLMQEKRAKQQPLQGQARGDVSDGKDKDAANGKHEVQKDALSKEGTLAREAADTSEPAAGSGVSNDN